MTWYPLLYSLPCFVEQSVLRRASDKGPAPPLVRRNVWNVGQGSALPAPPPQAHCHALDQIGRDRLELLGELCLPRLEYLQGCEPVSREGAGLHFGPDSLLTQVVEC